MLINSTGSDVDQSDRARIAAANNVKSAVAAAGSDDVKLKAACRDMEAVFLNMLLTEMRSSVPKDSLLGDNSGEDVMKSMLDTEYSKSFAQAGGIGLGDMLYRQLSQKAGGAVSKPSDNRPAREGR